jgi:uncharacterized membrane protein
LSSGVRESLAVNRKELDQLWANQNNWGLVYRCAEDPRVIVPRRRPWMGWTINFPHPFAWLVVFFSMALVVGPVIVLLQLGVVSVLLIIAVLIASICALVGLSHWEATRSRE